MNKRERLEKGEIFITSERGNSMTPLIKSGQKHKLSPCELEDCAVGDIVYCKIKGKYYTHLVTALSAKLGVQISNNHGYVNGWTKQVYGKVIEIL